MKYKCRCCASNHHGKLTPLAPTIALHRLREQYWLIVGPIHWRTTLEYESKYKTFFQQKHILKTPSSQTGSVLMQRYHVHLNWTKYIHGQALVAFRQVGHVFNLITEGNSRRIDNACSVENYGHLGFNMKNKADQGRVKLVLANEKTSYLLSGYDIMDRNGPRIVHSNRNQFLLPVDRVVKFTK